MTQFHRPRLLRKSEAMRSLVRETIISKDDFVVPLFVVEGEGVKFPIASMPGYYRISLDLLEREVSLLWGLGLRGVLLFSKVDDALKDNKGQEALNPKGLMQRAIRRVKTSCPEMVVMSDVALDPFSIYGHDGIVENDEIINDKTIDILAQMSVSHAESGVDVVAPSDMMDGRVKAIREALESSGHKTVGIMSYAAKYASAFYGPFREALDSTPSFGDKKTYQMDPANRKEAVKEAKLDALEGADILMVKPALPYLDIIREIKNETLLPVAAYQVSGEYAMIKYSCEKGCFDYQAIVMEQLMAVKRAGADLIISYFAKEIAEWDKKSATK